MSELFLHSDIEQMSSRELGEVLLSIAVNLPGDTESTIVAHAADRLQQLSDVSHPIDRPSVVATAEINQND